MNMLIGEGTVKHDNVNSREWVQYKLKSHKIKTHHCLKMETTIINAIIVMYRSCLTAQLR